MVICLSLLLCAALFTHWLTIRKTRAVVRELEESVRMKRRLLLNEPSALLRRIGMEPFLDFNAGYVLRSRDRFPKQGNRLPWKNYQNYIKDFISLRLGKLRDKELEFR